MSEVQTTIQANITDMPLNEWIYERVREFVTGRILEIATGSGNLAPICLQNNLSTDVMQIDLADESFDESYAHILGLYDTVIALHKADEIANNRLIAANCTKLLKSGGYLITCLAARTALYKGLDQGFKYWKRENLEFLDKVLHKDYSIIKMRYFMIVADLPSPVWVSKYIERVTLFNTNNVKDFSNRGLSIIAVGRKRL